MEGTADKTLFDFVVTALDGKEVALSDYKDKPVALVVNTASA